MSMLMTTGLTSALLSAKTYYSLAENPMRVASNELKNINIDLGVLDTSLEYGTKQLVKAEFANLQAGIELQKAQAMARKEMENLQASRLEERREKNAQRAEDMMNGGEVRPININTKDDESSKSSFQRDDNSSKKSMWSFIDDKKESNLFSSFNTTLYNKTGAISSFLK